jgi:hypothetical protein
MEAKESIAVESVIRNTVSGSEGGRYYGKTGKSFTQETAQQAL